jgi:molecular chaperone HtpG
MAATAGSYQFQAETKQLLDLMIHSLYTNKDIFLRELISNASDAIERLRFESLTRSELLEGDDKFEIRLEVDREARTLTISDNGIGMSRDEVISNIGTIARSGARELRERIQQGQSEDSIAELIGQFGVGFYSSFMVADKVTLVTRRAGEEGSTCWESAGDGYYTLTDADRQSRRTSITMHLKPVDPENGIEDYTDNWILARLVKRYSDFVRYPIVFKDQRPMHDRAESNSSAQGAEKEDVGMEDKVLNSMKPLWLRAQSEISESEYKEFYKHISHDWTEPLKSILLRAEGKFEYQALLFIPSKAPQDLYYHAARYGLRLYAKRVMIIEYCEDLLPRYLRFLRGVVDSADLPLNISRQMLQQDRHFTQIRKWLTKKVLDNLKKMFEKENDLYQVFWKEFGKALKEGVSSDYENKDTITSLLLFESSNDQAALTTLRGYVERMKPDQEEIFFLTGETRRVVENSPHLEAFKQKGYEVLFLVDPVDELVVQSLTEFEGKKLKSVGKGTIKLGNEDEKLLAEKGQEATELLGYLQKELDKHIKQVRITNRLTQSPACLVVEDHEFSPQLERLLRKGNGEESRQRRILELNPNHEVFARMQRRFSANKEDPALSNYAKLLFGYAVLAEGSELPDPIELSHLLAELMVENL